MDKKVIITVLAAFLIVLFLVNLSPITLTGYAIKETSSSSENVIGMELSEDLSLVLGTDSSIHTMPSPSKEKPSNEIKTSSDNYAEIKILSDNPSFEIEVYAPEPNSNFSIILPEINFNTTIETNCTYAFENETYTSDDFWLNNNNTTHFFNGEMGEGIDISFLHDGIYNLSIFCMNSSNNEDNTSVPILFIKDATPPEIEWLSPTEDEIIRIHHGFFFVVSVYDETTNVESVYFQISNTTDFSEEKWEEMDYNSTTSNFESWIIFEEAYEDGWWYMGVNVNDSSGNNNLSIIEIYIDNTPPYFSYLNPPTNTHSTESVLNVSFISEDDGAGDPKINAMLNCTVEIRNSTNHTLVLFPSHEIYSGTLSPDFEIDLEIEGEYSWIVTCLDNAEMRYSEEQSLIYGNTNSTEQIYFYDISPPDVYISSPENDTIYSPSHLIPLESEEEPSVLPLEVFSNAGDINETSWKFKLNDEDWQNFNPNTTIIPVSGNNTLTVYVEDLAGNSNNTSVNFYFDDVPVEILSITISPDNFICSISPYTQNQNFSINVQAIDISGVEELNITIPSIVLSHTLECVPTLPIYDCTGEIMISDTSLYDFEEMQIDVIALDGSGNEGTIGENTSEIVLYNLTEIVVNNTTCFEFGETSTNPCLIEDFKNANFFVEILKNGSSDCNLGNEMPWGDEFKTVAKLNFSSIDLSNSPKESLFLIEESIKIFTLHPFTFGDSYVFVNTSSFTNVTSNVNVTLYGVPFTKIPRIYNHEKDSLITTASIVLEEPYVVSGMQVPNAAISFIANIFSRYNLFDNTTPSIYLTSPEIYATNETFLTPSIIIDGTGTQISNASFVFNGTPLAEFNHTEIFENETCTNLTNEWDVINCSFSMTELDEGYYIFNITAYDFGGESPGNKETLPINFTVDWTPPLVSFLEPTTLTGNYSQNFIATNISATDINLQTTVVYIYNTTGLVRSQASPNPTSFANFTDLSDGVYYLNATASDTAGNTNHTETRTILLDTINPSIYFQGSTTTDGNYSQDYVYINLSVSDTNLISTVTNLYKNSVLVRTESSSSTNPVYNFTGLSDGVYYLNATASDTAGNTNSTETRIILLDTTFPEIKINSPFEINYNAKEILVNINATDTHLDKIWYNWNGTNTTYSVPHNIIFPEGEHTLTAWTNDTSGNVNSTSVMFSVDVTPPEIFNILVSDLTNSSATINVETNELASCILNYGLNTSHTEIKNMETADNLSHSVEIENLISGTKYYYKINCSDVVGNINSSSGKEFITRIHQEFEENETKIITFYENIEGVDVSIVELKITGTGTANISVFRNESGSGVASGKNSAETYVFIEVDGEFEVDSVVIKVYYNSTKISKLNLNENTLRLYYYNNGVWEILPGNIEKTEKYVWGETTSLSEYAIFGDLISPPSPSPGTGSGGGGAAPPATVGAPESYLWEEDELIIDMTSGNVIIFIRKNVEHSIILTHLFSDKVMLEIRSEPVLVTLFTGESQEVDVNKDGHNDIRITLERIHAGRATLFFEKLEEVPLIEVPEEVEEPEIEEILEIVEEEPEKQFLSETMINALIIAGVATGIILVVYFLLKKRKESRIFRD